MPHLPEIMVMKYLILLAVFSVSVILAACSSAPPLDRAFAGNMAKAEETKTIVGYCQSCHVHRDFDSADHLVKVPVLYDKKPYNVADRCTTCHWIERNFWHDITQHTKPPAGRLYHE